MIVDLPDTSVRAVSKKLVALRDDVGAMALGRVLTLVAVVDEAHVGSALDVASAATRQHPSRIVMLVTGNRRGADRIDAQIRVGGDAGASEIVVMRLYGELTRHGASVALPLLLADSPVVAWWPNEAPKDVASDPVGVLAQRRITDAEHSPNPIKTIAGRAKSYADGDTDLTWTRTTKWRGLLAAALDQPPFQSVTAVTVAGGLDSAATDLLAGWLGAYLDVPVTRARTPAGTGIVSVRLERESGPIDLVRPEENIATFAMPGQQVRRLALPRRQDAECLADELARLDPDEVYERSLITGLALLSPKRSMTAGDAAAKGLAPSVDEARRASEQVRRAMGSRGSATMVTRETPADDATSEGVHELAEERLEEVREDREG
ncbi:glucose-6-phosphate dehydrogenase assembly protein OpcA [Agilicoccus flavus]|uniref:glucose-6-phosphate dehydrogenase assembly protein OpcA n=1 Tax=Agilicoccus flavus TaxID=2775968 RepID=UPI001CF6E0D1|nr:glucose-6-phosphate dehydrogenase assembly protein OpcA [Agilicoccus flavus]